MNILGIGGWEFALVLLIMLIVAGPKRMVRWAYTLGQYTAKLRKMWEETAGMLQKEFEEAGLDIEVPKTPPTRANLNSAVRKQVEKTMQPITKPLEESLQEVDNLTKLKAAAPAGNGRKAGAVKEDTATPDDKPDSASNFGTWSSAKMDDEEGA